MYHRRYADNLPNTGVLDRVDNRRLIGNEVQVCGDTVQEPGRKTTPTCKLSNSQGKTDRQAQ